MHLIIDTEDAIIANAAPAEGAGNHPHSDDSTGSAAAAAILQLLQEELLSRLFPGVTPQLPSHGVGVIRSATTTTIVQLQQSVVTLENRIHSSAGCAMMASNSGGDLSNAADTIAAVADSGGSCCNSADTMASVAGSAAGSAVSSNTDCAVFQTPPPPSVLGVHPAAVCCQLPSLDKLASPPEDPAALLPLASPPEDDAACLPVSGGSWITVWLQLSAPLPSEGVTLLARYRGGFLDARLERAEDGQHDVLTIKVRGGVTLLARIRGDLLVARFEAAADGPHAATLIKVRVFMHQCGLSQTTDKACVSKLPACV